MPPDAFQSVHRNILRKMWVVEALLIIEFGCMGHDDWKWLVTVNDQPVELCIMVTHFNDVRQYQPRTTAIEVNMILHMMAHDALRWL